ncbi:uncharacterized protein LOC142563889 isoform X2 [Dermacentor variabilis]|uniref:uncharacterized protein LOC142563889 isoform X2 n=1 Tax=Dermacentor variabilis TaxID=34621 RepID=UPI003F5C2E14
MAIDLYLTTEQCSYSWAPTSDKWGSHFPIVISPGSGRRPRSRTYHVTDWSLFWKHCSKLDDGRDFLSAIADCAQASTVQCSAQPDTPALDLHLFDLNASRRRMERRANRTGKAEHWTEYRRADARCRRQTRRRRSLCSAIEGRFRGPLAWRLLKSPTSRRASLPVESNLYSTWPSCWASAKRPLRSSLPTSLRRLYHALQPSCR